LQSGDTEPFADREDLFEDGAGNRIGIGGTDLRQVGDDVVGARLAVGFGEPTLAQSGLSALHVEFEPV
jgi:hypothetical protein